MRALFALAGIAALAIAPMAQAAPINVTLSPELQTKVEEEIGEREMGWLEDMVVRNVSRALAARGGDNVTVDVTIVDADPNRPTRQRLVNMPGLSEIYSVSTGGAELVGTLRSADGRVLGEVSHRYYSSSLADLTGPPTTWTDAHRAVSRFSRKVADAYSASGR
jgi:hypothetical protein